MNDLDSVDLSFGNFKLEKLDVWNEEHIEFLRELRDEQAVEMCHDVMDIVMTEKELKYCCRNLFLATNEDGYFGYMYISNDIEGERELAYIIQEKVRGKGLGTILVTSVSDFLLESYLAYSLKLCVRPDNEAGIKLATRCGFMRMDEENEEFDVYSKCLVY